MCGISKRTRALNCGFVSYENIKHWIRATLARLHKSVKKTCVPNSGSLFGSWAASQ